METAKYRSYRSLLANSIPIITLLFWGAWSDMRNRKTPMLLGLSTTIISELLLIGCVFIPTFGGLAVSMLIVLPSCFTGGTMTFTNAAYSYISENSDSQTRTIRLGMVAASSSLGVPLGFAIAGSLLKANLQFHNAFMISGSLALLGVVIVLLRVKEPPKDIMKNAEMSLHEGGLLKHLGFMCKGIWDVLATKRAKGGRLRLIALLLVYVCVAIPLHGEFGVMYLYLRNQFGWDAGAYGLFSIYNSVTASVGMLLSMGILSTWAKLPDAVVGFIAGIGQFIACFLYAFATSPVTILIAPLVDMMNGTMWVVSKSMVSKIVGTEEYGRTFTFFSLLTVLIPLMADPLYALVYRSTLATALPGSVFLLSAAFTVPPETIYGILSWRLCQGKVRGKAKQYSLSPTTASVEPSKFNKANNENP